MFPGLVRGDQPWAIRAVLFAGADRQHGVEVGYAKWELTGESGSNSSAFQVSCMGPMLEVGLHF